MKRLALLLFALAPLAFGQAIRVDVPLQTSGPNVPSGGSALPQALWVSNATIFICTHPQTTLAGCQANPVVTYTNEAESGTCPSSTPLVQLPGTTCTASVGPVANIGFWYAGGTVDYWVVSSYGTFGPYTISRAASSAANPSPPGLAVQFANSGVTTFQGDSAFTYDPTSHSLTTAMKDHGGQVYNVVTFGADPTGTTDSATAINAAIAAANGRQVYIPAGTYKIQSTLILVTTGQATPGFKMYGDGKGKTILQCTAPFTQAVGFGGCIALIGVDGTRLFDYANGGWIRDLTITSSGSPASLDGLYIAGQNTFHLDNVQITGMTGDGVRYPLRVDWSSNPDAYASIDDEFNSNSIDSNGGYGINQECGLCAAVHTFRHNHIGLNAKDGIFVAAHMTNIVDGNTIASNGSGTAGSQNVPLSACVGGGIKIGRVQTNPVGVIIKGNGDFDSNCLYSIWESADVAADVSFNRFISHAGGTIWPQTKQNIPAVHVKMGFASQGALSATRNANYFRSDSVVPGVPNAAVDSSLTAFMFDFFNVQAANILMNSMGVAANTGNLTGYALGGGAILTCSGTGTPTCNIDQGGHYSTTPTLAVPTGYGCSGTPTATLTSGVITSINMGPVTGCTSAPPFLITSVVPYPSSNSLAITIADNFGVESAPASTASQYTITNGGASITLWNSTSQLREENGTTPNSSAGIMTHRIYHDTNGTDSSGMDLDVSSGTNVAIKSFITGADSMPGIALLPGTGGNSSIGSNNALDIVDDFASTSFKPVTDGLRSLGTASLAWSNVVTHAMQGKGTGSATGCSLTFPHGAWVGDFTSGTTGTCTVVITPGITAATGFVCHANDLTTPADTLPQTASSTTTCTVAGTTISGDFINFTAIAY